MDATPQEKTLETKVPARLDALTWGRFHSLIIVALGITWILDGLEVTFAGLISGALKKDLAFSDSDVGLGSSFYLAGAVIGALVFGWATDRLGRRVLFFVTLGTYLVATAATAFSWDLWSFCLFRFLTGAGIGGEYSAVNSTIQEFIPAKYRGQTDSRDQRLVLDRRRDGSGSLYRPAERRHRAPCTMAGARSSSSARCSASASSFCAP